ncbi:MAG: hypothetical protein IKE42_24165 [Aquamicrobium sp.]|uniref:hypothetical protein n=1 Tax=Mesorhizobium sp. Pch-S TaxID=2082387 RepID=UPI00101197F3|nr:hypothetical protein [Mesorhizobium sp. Pch-S]MBR2690959.1 hypothetical protein [Aquamicrobium sp.]QAZ47125.1 hypothetical protein C1M53_11530 [Mesorhizobium sp. Pch-S]
MDTMRRALLGLIGTLPTWRSSFAAKPGTGETPMDSSGSEAVKPRHVLCFLGKERDLAPLSDAASGAIAEFATGFSIDETYSQAEPDDRMARSFDVCWDRVEPDAWTKADEAAVASHQSVLYVLGPRMTRNNAVTVSTAALFLVDRMIDKGALAVKGESAGIAHGLSRWKQLALQAASAVKADDVLGQRRIGRLAFAKRPLSARGYLESVGFHLVGLPEVYVPISQASEREAVATMDAVADEIAEKGLEDVLRKRRANLSFESQYEEDEFKFNPYGTVMLAG